MPYSITDKITGKKIGIEDKADNAAVIIRNRIQFSKIGDESSSCDSYIDKGESCYKVEYNSTLGF